MSHDAQILAAAAFGLSIAFTTAGARAQPADPFTAAVSRAFTGVEACVALRDVAAGAEPMLSDPASCGRRLPPCATFDIPATVVALDRGVVPDANAPVKRNPPLEGDPQDGVNLRDAFRRPVAWVYEEVARRVGSDAFAKALQAMRYGNAETSGSVERLGRGEEAGGLTLSSLEQLEFLARLKRGELPTTAEAQARTVEIVPTEPMPDGVMALKSGACDGVAWAVGWTDRARKVTVFAVAETGGAGMSAEDVTARTKRMLNEIARPPAPPK